MCTVLLPPGVNPIAVNKYIINHIVDSVSCIHALVAPNPGRKGVCTDLK